MPKPGDYSGGTRPSTRSEDDPSKFYFGNLFKDGLYHPKHPVLFEFPPRWNEWLDPTFLRAHAEVMRIQQISLTDQEKHEAVKQAWATALTKECDGGGPGVWSFDAFTSEFCTMLIDEVDFAQDKYGALLTRPNGMNRYGMVLNQLGLEPAITELQQRYIKPLQHFLFGQEGFAPDDHHCFIVRYNKEEDVGLDMHSDSSDVTLNVCLGREFSGSTLTFCGLVGNRDHRLMKHVYHHQVGRAVIHLGRQRHGADDLESGERLSFILWNTSKSWRDSDEYFKTLMRRKGGPEASPDLVCLSYTHDEDYTQFREALTRPEAVRRGVMLDMVRSDPAVQARMARNGGG